MNEVIKNIITRRSVRSFLPKKVEFNLIEEILKSAMQAPTAFNSQSWRFIIIDNASKLAELANNDEQKDVFLQSAVVILVCAKSEDEAINHFLHHDIGATSQNILLSSHSLGLGAVWIAIWGVMPRIEIINKLCKLPSDIKPIVAIAIGYPNEKPEFEDRFDKKKICFNEWKE